MICTVPAGDRLILENEREGRLLQQRLLPCGYGMILRTLQGFSASFHGSGLLYKRAKRAVAIRLF